MQKLELLSLTSMLESNTDINELKDTLSLEINKIRTELFNTQQLLSQKDEELIKTQDILKECDAALTQVCIL